MAKKLKIGFVIKEVNRVPAWYFETISEISGQDNIASYFLIFKSSKKINKKGEGILYSLFKKFETWWFKSKFDVTEEKNIKALLNSSNTIEINTAENFVLSEEEINKIKKYQLDVIYTIDFDPAQTENLSEIAAYGLWYIKFGHGKYAGNKPVAFWEVMDDSAMTGSYLLARKDKKDMIIYEGVT